MGHSVVKFSILAVLLAGFSAQAGTGHYQCEAEDGKTVQLFKGEDLKNEDDEVDYKSEYTLKLIEGDSVQRINGIATISDVNFTFNSKGRKTKYSLNMYLDADEGDAGVLYVGRQRTHLTSCFEFRAK
jgi:hypothetical protein